MSFPNSIWNQIPSTKIPGTQFTLIGHSWAAKNTCFYVQEMKMMLDCGVPNNWVPDHVFITHGHSDHSKEIPNTIVQLSSFKNQQQKKVNIYAPIEMVEYIRNYIDAFYIMSKNNPTHKVHSKYNLIPVEANTRIQITIRNIKHIVEIIKCFHTVPCVGYGFIEIRKRLKQEFHGLTQQEIIAIKKSGIDIQEEFEHPLFCYLGDTNDWVFTNKETSEILKKYSVIMSECSFISEDQLAQAKKKKHIYIENIDEIIKNNLNKTFILYHFSDRYEEQDLIDFFIKKGYPNVLPWVSLAKNTNKNSLPWQHFI